MAVDTPLAPTATAPSPNQPTHPGPRRTALGVVALVVVTAVALLWSKWWPYAHKVASLADSRHWSAPSVLDKAGRAGNAPSLHRGWEFTVAYGKSVWKAYLAALVIGAAASSLVPRSWLARALGGRTARDGTLRGGLLGSISLMCTACAAPVAVSLRRDGVRPSSTLAFLYASPALNPAVLAFLALVGPWQWVTTRIVVGLVLVFGLSFLVARLAPDADEGIAPQAAVEPAQASDVIRAFVTRFGSLAVMLTPLYFVLMLLEGTFRGGVFPLTATTAAVAAVIVALLLGTIVDLPTAGEVPILLALSAAGLGTAATGALLITLPAISFATLLLMLRSHGARVTAGAGAAVVLAGLLSAGLLTVLS